MSIFEYLERTAEERELQFLLIGGHAVNVYGYSRTTVDVDVLAPKKDRERWMKIAQERGYQLKNDGGFFLQFEKEQAVPLDCMFVNDETFAKLYGGSHPVRVQESNVRVPHLHHLLALKLHALNQDLRHRSLKDFLDAVELVRINKVELDSPEMTEILERYANAELKKRFIKACEDQRF